MSPTNVRLLPDGTALGFFGLSRSSGPTLLDGTAPHIYWTYSVGYFENFRGGNPTWLTSGSPWISGGPSATKTELFVFMPGT